MTSALIEITKHIKALTQITPYDANMLTELMRLYDMEILRLREENEKDADIEKRRTTHELRRQGKITNAFFEDDRDEALNNARKLECDHILDQRRRTPSLLTGVRKTTCHASRVSSERTNEEKRVERKARKRQDKKMKRREEEMALLQEASRQRNERKACLAKV